MLMLNPYLGFNGQCREAFEFYAKTFNGQIVAMIDHKSVPGGDQFPADTADRIMHARLIINGNITLMGGDNPGTSEVKPQGFCVNIGVDDPAEAERLFLELSDGAQITMPMSETFWAHRFGMLIDRYGTPWMINCEKPMQ